MPDPLLRFRYSAAEIAITNTEFDGDIAFALLVINKRSAGIERDGSKLFQRNVSIRAAGARNRDFDVADRFEVRAVFGRKSNNHGELAIAFQQGGRRRAAERGLDHSVHIAGVKTIAGGFSAIDLDIEIRLAEDVEYLKIGDAPHLLHLLHHLGRDPLDGRQIAANDFHRIGAFNAGQRLLDIVLNVL